MTEPVKVTTDNFKEVLNSTLLRCKVALQEARRDQGISALAYDLAAAVEALEEIRKEIYRGPKRPKGRRSAAFTRYVIDEKPQMAMDERLRDLIIQIEDAYMRF